jgi:hypothetical protein
MGNMKQFKQLMKQAGQVIVGVLAGIAVAVLLVLKWLWNLLAKNANVLTLVGVIIIILMLCRG